ncbi:histone H4 transcription factor [Papilio machaon]|uniref:histone H4 transcription factor n=1 Tax=Papilio machaon TaxID=76193 RepID=UPI001E664C4E|nr:histone H4 transcription factor [Papilio machaon]
MDNSKKKLKLDRCLEWLKKQNEQEPKKLALQNKNDIQFIIQTNADRKNFLLAAAEDEATVPSAVDDNEAEPKAVPLRELRRSGLVLECEWLSCRRKFTEYEEFQTHVAKHVSNLHLIKEEDKSNQYFCLWDTCGHKTVDLSEMVRHINYHAYHAKLLAIGLNGRATLNLAECKKDSSKRNQLPSNISEHCCLWVGCTKTYQSIDEFIKHVKEHIDNSRNLCSWAGCGATFTRRTLFIAHVRSHTGERLIACYHCGQHFANNRKLCDHIRRQNVNPQSNIRCDFCGVLCASEYLKREHARQHVSLFACSMCDMTAPTLSALAQHVRYRHVAARPHPCPHCHYRAITKRDLLKHIPTHTRKKRKLKGADKSSDVEMSDEDSEEEVSKKPKEKRKYVCHMCPEKEKKIFSRGTRLTTHLVKVHGAQWPCGYSRFRYQLSEDGMYRLTETRFEEFELSQKIVDGYSDPKKSLTDSYEFEVQRVSEATATSPVHFEIRLKSDKNDQPDETSVEITMCDVDEQGNIINSEVIQSDVVYT